MPETKTLAQIIQMMQKMHQQIERRASYDDLSSALCSIEEELQAHRDHTLGEIQLCMRDLQREIAKLGRP
jgi:hypothetical protein